MTEQNEDTAMSPARRQIGKWISGGGWLLAASGGVCLIIGLADLQNLALLAILGVVFIPIGLLLVTNGRILTGLAKIEKNTRPSVAPAPSQPRKGSRSH